MQFVFRFSLASITKLLVSVGLNPSLAVTTLNSYRQLGKTQFCITTGTADAKNGGPSESVRFSLALTRETSMSQAQLLLGRIVRSCRRD